MAEVTGRERWGRRVAAVVLGTMLAVVHAAGARTLRMAELGCPLVKS